MPPQAPDLLTSRRPLDALIGALRAALTLCACGGTGKRTTSCSMCHDSTWDHECDDREVDCTRAPCVAGRALLEQLMGAPEGEPLGGLEIPGETALEIREALVECVSLVREHGLPRGEKALTVLDAAPGWLVVMDTDPRLRPPLIARLLGAMNEGAAEGFLDRLRALLFHEGDEPNPIPATLTDIERAVRGLVERDGV